MRDLIPVIAAAGFASIVAGKTGHAGFGMLAGYFGGMAILIVGAILRRRERPAALSEDRT